MILMTFARDISLTLAKGAVGTGSGLYMVASAQGDALARSLGLYFAACAGFLTCIKIGFDVAKAVRNWRQKKRVPVEAMKDESK